MDMIGVCILFCIGGMVISAAYWVSVYHAERDGYKAGYAQAEREFQQRQTAAMMARFEAEHQMRNSMNLIGGYRETWVQRQPLGQEVAHGA